MGASGRALWYPGQAKAWVCVEGRNCWDAGMQGTPRSGFGSRGQWRGRGWGGVSWPGVCDLGEGLEGSQQRTVILGRLLQRMGAHRTLVGSNPVLWAMIEDKPRSQINPSHHSEPIWGGACGKLWHV